MIFQFKVRMKLNTLQGLFVLSNLKLSKNKVFVFESEQYSSYNTVFIKNGHTTSLHIPDIQVQKFRMFLNFFSVLY